MNKKYKNNIKGLSGEALVSLILINSQQCYVRQVTSQTDIGIDLFCETINEKINYHFWIQVKSGKQVKWIVNSGNPIIVFQSIQTKHIKYWLKQPVPVFLCGVTEEKIKNISSKELIWMIDIHKWAQDRRNAKKLERYKNITIKELQGSSSCLVRVNFGETKRFFEYDLPKAIFRVASSKGVIVPVQLGGYFSSETIFFSEADHRRIKRSIWNGAFVIANDIYNDNFDSYRCLWRDNLYEEDKKEFLKSVAIIKNLDFLDAYKRSFMFFTQALQKLFDKNYNKAVELQIKAEEHYKKAISNNKKMPLHWSRFLQKWTEMGENQDKVLKLLDKIPKDTTIAEIKKVFAGVPEGIVKGGSLASMYLDKKIRNKVFKKIQKTKGQKERRDILLSYLKDNDWGTVSLNKE